MVVTTEPQEFVVERTLQRARGEEEVTVRLGIPRPDPGNVGLWICPFQVVGVGSSAVHLVSGVDGFEALLVALGTIAVLLRADEPGDLTWLGRPELGFPILFGPQAEQLSPKAR